MKQDCHANGYFPLMHSPKSLLRIPDISQNSIRKIVSAAEIFISQRIMLYFYWETVRKANSFKCAIDSTYIYHKERMYHFEGNDLFENSYNGERCSQAWLFQEAHTYRRKNSCR